MQLVAVVVIVGLAAGYVAWSACRLVAGKKAGCGSGCGKCAAPAVQPPPGRVSLPQV
ncbi:FeoB-associated Cys-rich membrane protein [bacterium]|nr:FeoB-associated Cys-rich membrane protein [bacterium]